MRIRPAVPDDAPGVVALRAVVYPYLVRGVASTRRMIADPAPGSHRTAFVAELDARVVGWACAYRNTSTSEPDVGEISLLHVHPDHRRQGAGAALFAAVRQHLADIGVRRVRSLITAEALDFARRRGFEPSRTVRYSALELRQSASPPPALPAGARLVPVARLDPRRLYDADAAATADEPGDVTPDAVGYEDWRWNVYDDVGLDRSLSTAAVLGTDVVAFSLVHRDGARVWSDMTATVPAHRGRGWAALVKTAALRRAAAAGVTTAYTCNDESNTAMLAVNSRLGYRPVAAQLSCLATPT